MNRTKKLLFSARECVKNISTITDNNSKMNLTEEDHVVDAAKKIHFQTFQLPGKLPGEDVIKERNQSIVEIFTGRSNIKVDFFSVACCFLGIVTSIVLTLATTMYPLHDAIGNHEYWYECLIPYIFGWLPICVALIGANGLLLLGVGGRSSVNISIIMYCAGIIPLIAFECLFYFLWVNIGGYVWPMPFQGYIIMPAAGSSASVIFYILCTRTWKSSALAKRKTLYALVFLNSMIVGEWFYKIMLWLFQNLDENYQWTLAFLLLAVRALNFRMLTWCAAKTVGVEDASVTIIAAHFSAMRHVLFLSVNLVNSTTLTSYLILGSDFVINVVSCAKILIYIKNPSEKNEKRKQSAILVLIVNETVELIGPIIYSLCLLLAYHGPNAEVLGNVKSGLWQYVAIDDIYETYFWIVLMVFIDLISTVISFAVLQIYAHVNIIKAYIQMQKVLGYVLVLQQTYMMTEYVVLLYTSLGCDFTFQFEWLDGCRDNSTGNSSCNILL